jgi:hypothetical protein
MAKTYDVVVLGAEGTGKTVFLASMYHKLSTQRPDTRFFLSVPDDQRRTLVQKYNQIADPYSGWPPGTPPGEVSKWSFTVRVRAEDDNLHDAFLFNYWDYAGEHLTRTQGSQVDSIFRTAHALLGILDGQKILWLLKREPSPTGSIHSDLGNILPVMDNNINPATPVHFIISKWDLIFNNNYKLEQVRDELLQFDQFRQFVEARRERKIPVRLIPVSSVGMDYVEMKISPDGLSKTITMEKRLGAAPKPFQVETPIACVIPDKLKVELERLMIQVEKEKRRNIEVSPDLSFWDHLGVLFGGLVEGVR